MKVKEGDELVVTVRVKVVGDYHTKCICTNYDPKNVLALDTGFAERLISSADAVYKVKKKKK